MPFFVKKLEWEYGEKFGHVFYPQSMEALKAKLESLHLQALEDKYPFYIEIFFLDGTYVGLIVGLELSCFHFGIPVSNEQSVDDHNLRFDIHCDNTKGNSDAYIEYYYKTSLSEKHLSEMLPVQQVFDALYQYVETRKIPSYILFTREEFTNTYRSY